MLINPTVGKSVRVLAPFDESFPATYQVTEVITQPDGQIVCILTDDAGGFDPEYLVEVTQ